jgi:hypothetical protein
LDVIANKDHLPLSCFVAKIYQPVALPFLPVAIPFLPVAIPFSPVAIEAFSTNLLMLVLNSKQ